MNACGNLCSHAVRPCEVRGVGDDDEWVKLAEENKEGAKEQQEERESHQEGVPEQGGAAGRD